GREGIQAALQLRALGPLDQTLPAPGQRPREAVEQFLIIERLLQEIEGPALHGTDRGRHGTVAGNENDGEVAPRLTQRLLHIQTTRAGESDIEDETCRTINRGVVEKCLGRPKGLGGESHRANESRRGRGQGGGRDGGECYETDGEGAECPDRRRHGGVICPRVVPSDRAVIVGVVTLLALYDQGPMCRRIRPLADPPPTCVHCDSWQRFANGNPTTRGPAPGGPRRTGPRRRRASSGGPRRRPSWPARPSECRHGR